MFTVERLRELAKGPPETIKGDTIIRDWGTWRVEVEDALAFAADVIEKDTKS